MTSAKLKFPKPTWRCRIEKLFLDKDDRQQICFILRNVKDQIWSGEDIVTNDDYYSGPGFCSNKEVYICMALSRWLRPIQLKGEKDPLVDKLLRIINRRLLFEHTLSSWMDKNGTWPQLVSQRQDARIAWIDDLIREYDVKD